MSIKYMDRVWTTHELKGGALLLMLALADHANDAGECWPSQQHLAEKARLDVRQVRRVIGQLIKEGYVNIVERHADRGKKTKYQLFPGQSDKAPADKKADKMSAQKAEEMSEKKRTFCPPDILSPGHLQHEKADISDTIHSHARSESPIEPSGGNGIISSSDAVSTFDPWALCLKELSVSLPSGFVSTLTDSRIEIAGSAKDANGKPIDIYRVLIAPDREGRGLSHFSRQAGPEIRRRLSSILRKPLLIDIVVDQPQPESEPTP